MAGFWASVFLCRPKPRALAGSTMVVAMGTRGREPFREGNLILERVLFIIIIIIIIIIILLLLLA